MSTLPGSADQAAQPQVFRRRSTVTTAFVVAAILMGVSIWLAVDEAGHGFFAIIAAPVVGLTLALFVVLLSAYPHVIVRDDHLEPHNSFVWYVVPYPAIAEIVSTRMGLIVKGHGKKEIPLSGYASGTGRRIFGHRAAAGEIINAVEARMARSKRPGDEDATIVRHLERRNTYAMVGAVVVSIVVVVLAVQTYH
jgi:hypothetical protein